MAPLELANMVRMGVMVFDFGADGMEFRRAETGHILEASKQILDRISTATAPKNTMEMIGVTLEEWRAQQAQRQAQADEALAAFATHDLDNEQ